MKWTYWLKGGIICRIMNKITVTVYLTVDGNFTLEIISGKMSEKQEDFFRRKFNAYRLVDGRYLITGYYAIFRDEIITALWEFGFDVDPIFWDDLY